MKVEASPKYFFFTKIFLGVAISLIFLSFFVLGHEPSALAFAKKSAVRSPVSVKKYSCPMQCQLSDQSGKCPKCGMEMWEVS